ncbi:rhodanese-like domain-containing protein [Siphonobacter sp. SORGH_AS_1065]|uniref:MBL fold metallo-hydrolase n=1 Tax=Siphonobacter sp. SORGH_AS_1065 TaxID=3041795 RepID=UPI002781017E|nr:MBL fold metallo-hydrolase [Siphonobacter sp. SORGH_AS_1065]MDQ1087990.1 hydroxyacylglutathione hydrolase [Siphonobacter sp. SORGH_AS_1065]
MIIEQLYTGCLAQGAYYIQVGNEAAIIDPLREVQTYINKASRNGATIKYIFETHFHADFVSGHVDLSAKTGAPIIYGPNAKPAFEATIATDGQEFKLGDHTLRLLHTPGHTMESSCILLLDETGKEKAVFTGDTLFIGDVGRPDLAQKADLTQDDLAGFLYESLRSKLLPLPNEVIVYPAHGAGSACGKNMSKETFDTLGHQKEVNYALQPQTKEQFIEAVTDGLTPPPAYFPENVRLNKEGIEPVEKVLKRGNQPLSPEAFEAVANTEGALVLDTRKPQEFSKAFIPRSINIGIDGDFAPWVGTLIPDINQPLLLVTAPGREEEVITRLSRVGYDQVLGFLQGGMDSWLADGRETDAIESIHAETFAERFANEEVIVKDVRKPSEYEVAHVAGAENTPLASLSDHMAEFPKDQPFYVHCAGGYRSMIAASILKARGYDQVREVAGGFGAIAKTSVATESGEMIS